MDSLRIPNRGWVIVGDGRKAIFLRNAGTAAAPQLVVAHAEEASANPKTSDQGSERPGRVVNSGDGRRSSVDQPDYHDEQEIAFARKIADEIGALCADKTTTWVALVAAPRTLAVWRRQIPDKAKAKIGAEVAKDLTKHAVPELTRMLTGVGASAAA